ncbi:Cadherin-12 [Liparis tanakae]|uniref:Cadherin-12 n=1 Tax=Liparis tanakae TaxID=230148 RepID=A0A4Z2ECJ1_9TELE|nr:Cadherin-12 [Liparis tanakae]
MFGLFYHCPATDVENRCCIHSLLPGCNELNTYILRRLHTYLKSLKSAPIFFLLSSHLLVIVSGIFHLWIPESASFGSAVGQIPAHDLDAGSNADLNYVLVPGDEGDMFDIVSNSHLQEGVVILKKTLDYETKKSYTFTVEVSNPQLDHRFLHLGPFKDSATVTVNVVDTEEPPVFTELSYSMDVYEDTPPGTTIGSVTAHDLDASSSAVR